MPSAPHWPLSAPVYAALSPPDRSRQTHPLALSPAESADFHAKPKRTRCATMGWAWFFISTPVDENCQVWKTSSLPSPVAPVASETSFGHAPPKPWDTSPHRAHGPPFLRGNTHGGPNRHTWTWRGGGPCDKFAKHSPSTSPKTLKGGKPSPNNHPHHSDDSRFT